MFQARGEPFSAQPLTFRLHKDGPSDHRSRLAGYADRCSRSGTGWIVGEDFVGVEKFVGVAGPLTNKI